MARKVGCKVRVGDREFLLWLHVDVATDDEDKGELCVVYTAHDKTPQQLNLQVPVCKAEITSVGEAIIDIVKQWNTKDTPEMEEERHGK